MRQIVRLSFFVLACCCLSSVAFAAAAPGAATRLMPKGAISLQWKEIATRTAAGPVWVHLYCVPRGHSKQLVDLGITRSGPVKREHITNGPSLKTSPFWLDIFRPSGESWRRLNSVAFEQDQDVNEIVLRWMTPKQRSGPVLLLHFGYSHWHEWEVFTFPQGWEKTSFHQAFLWGGEGEYYVTERFDRTDAAGRLVVEENAGTPEKTGTYRYRWNGREWQDAAQKYFVIGATSRLKTKAAAELARRGFGEVLFSSHYPRLRPGYYLWVAGRHRSMAEANEQLGLLKDEKIKTYIRRVR